MTRIDDSEAAFPNSIGPMSGRAGMTLRDWFAGQIAVSLTGGIAAAGISTDISDAEKVATAAYTLADAMIAARTGGDA